MAKSQRITQRDLAQHLGISQVTVSRALARSPLVPPAVQDQVHAAAATLGYIPDPVLSCLNAYRRTQMPIENGQTLAWITGQAERKSVPWFNGAKERARHYGYRLTTINPNEPNLTPRRMMSILYNQGVAGLIFAPQREAHTQLNIQLDPFSAISIGYTLEAPVIDRVITDHYRNCSLAYLKAYEAGYRRIGLTCGKSSNQRVEGREVSALLYQQYLHPDAAPIPPVLYSDSHESIRDLLVPWIRKWKPDAIICTSTFVMDICKEMNLRVPEDIAIIGLMVALNPDWDDQRSGINPLSYQTGSFAVDTIVALLRSNQRGIPTIRRTHMVEGSWVEGKTMRHPPESGDAAHADKPDSSNDHSQRGSHDNGSSAENTNKAGSARKPSVSSGTEPSNHRAKNSPLNRKKTRGRQA